MTTYQYEATFGPNGKRIRDAGPRVQRFVAVELAAFAGARIPRPRSLEGLAAVRAGQFGDTELQRSLVAESEAAEERYGQLAEAKEETEDRGETFPVDQAAELTQAHQTYRLYRLLAATLSNDPAEAALEAAHHVHGLVPFDDAEDKIEDLLDAAGVPELAGPAW